MAKLSVVVQTYFSSGNYRNNRVEIDIPNEAAELIKNMWEEKQVHNCTRAKYLASNQEATIKLTRDETLLDGMVNVCREETEEDEIFEHRFTSDEEDE